tara:strand:- start:187 stop:537 length:351 start_codon:yes stop_codon:yes gene_type:complete
MRKTEDILRKMLTETREIKLDNVPYAFEKRVMSHIQEAPQKTLNLWELWGQALWRTAIPCFSLMIFVVIWTSSQSATPETEFASEAIAPLTAQAETVDSDLEAIVMLAIDSPSIDQ